MEIPQINKIPLIKDRAFKQLLYKRDRSLNEPRSSQTYLSKLSFVNDTMDQKNISQTSRREYHKDRPPTIPLSATTLTRKSVTLSKQGNRQSPSRIVYTTADSERGSLTERRESQTKKFSLWKKIAEIKASLITKNLSQEDKQYPLRSSLRKVFECLELLNETDSVYGDLMSIITTMLKKAVYIGPNVLESYEQLIEVFNSEELRDLLDNLERDGSIPCYLLLSTILKEVLKLNCSKAQRNKDDVIKIQALESILNKKDQEIQSLEQELSQRVTPEEFIDLQGEIEETNDRCDNLKRENNKLADKNKELEGKVESLTKQLTSTFDQLDLHMLRISDLEYEKENLVHDIERRQRHITRLITDMNYFKDFKDKSILHLSTVKETISKLQRENNNLTEENRLLGLRAACGFEGLTPRPDFKRLQTETGLDSTLLLNPKNNKFLPTAQIAENMAYRLTNYDPLLTESESRELDISKRSRSKKGELKRSKSSSKAKTGKSDKNPVKSRPSIIVSTYKSFEGSTKPQTKALDDITPNKNMFNSEERLNTLTSKKSNEPSIQNDSFLSPNSGRGDTPYSNQKYQVNVGPIRVDEENNIGKDGLELTNQLLGCVIEANKIFEHSFNDTSVNSPSCRSEMQK